MALFRRLFLVLAGISLVAATTEAWAQSGRGPSPVVVSTVVRHSIQEPVWLVGTTEAPLRSVVASEVEGIVDEFPAHEGQMVGDKAKLAVLNKTVLENQLKAAQAILTRRSSELAELRKGLRPEEIAQAKAKLKAAQARFGLAEKNREREEGLAAKKAGTKQALDEAMAIYYAAEADLHVAEAAYALAEQGVRQEKRDQAEADEAAARAAVKRLERLVAGTTIRAPFAGQVIREHTQVGQWIEKGGEVAAIIQLDPVHISVPVPEHHISGVRLGQDVQVRVTALDTTERTGKVVRIIAQANVDAHTFPVKVELANKDWRIKAGMFAQVRFAVGKERQAVLAPKDAVVRAQGRTQLVTVDGDGKVVPIPVRLGERFAGMMEVLPVGPGETGPQPGLKVIVQGNERVREGQQVRVADTVPPERYLSKAPATQKDTKPRPPTKPKGSDDS